MTDDDHSSNEDSDGSEKRARSTISFPYNDLDSATEVARAIFSTGGQSCENEQLAGVLDVSARGGAYRARLSPPRIFGLIEVERGGVRLTQLGMNILDPQKDQKARVDSFLSVPLYRQVYESYKGRMLPKGTALEEEFVRLGVSPKQKDKARQVFERSARQAGFYWAGADRLTLPIIKDGPKDTDDHGSTKDEKADDRKDDFSSEFELHPFIEGLLKTLPKTGEQWDHAARVKWLKLAANAFDLIYTGEGTIEIKEIKSTDNF
ncbi:hypothetical protein FF098_005945 [Parvularcula flava]|uniref:Uncharacterized protein n=1 Tax=Aquisalinus luteolus TaxID=1566827 RepID=A0A8J3A1G0_9PROT|nr:hypothetical protein [Aquisalinus luteolus]NHK27440.1 hypothetical protein [Aquisalinus luteolus]GGH95444.1 hypothetical protein GCM10011355_12000 [Aquisalinus luteolus]